MNTRTIAVGLKIPDNAAFTALAALQRLNVRAARLERADVWVFETEQAGDQFIDAVKAHEALFNPNKHELVELPAAKPRKGEVWVEEIGEDPGLRALLGGKMIPGVLKAKRYTAWRLYTADGAPANPLTVTSAATLLLCNPAIERSIT